MIYLPKGHRTQKQEEKLYKKCCLTEGNIQHWDCGYMFDCDMCWACFECKECRAYYRFHPPIEFKKERKINKLLKLLKW